MIRIGNRILELSDFEAILYDKKLIEVDETALQEVASCHNFLSDFMNNKVIYGINTGFGPMAQYAIPQDKLLELQFNLIRSHAAGAGGNTDPQSVLCAMTVRLNSILRGFSGVHPDTVKVFSEFINKRIIPYVPIHGGVGASGDLVQLAHIALSMLGEGNVFFDDKMQPASKVLADNSVDPLKIYIREGLALTNGTSFMTGISVINVLKAKNLFRWTLAASSLLIEIVEGFDDFFSKELNAVKNHRGQNRVAALLREMLADSRMIRKRCVHHYNGTSESEIIQEKVQDNYSIRCSPQILGPVLEAMESAEEVVLNEVNAVSDNPVICWREKDVLHGGNFHGDYISFEMDKLKIAVTKLTMLIERQLNYLLNEKINHKLPPFVNLGTLGINLGMQGPQFTATSTTAENQTLSFPMYVHSIPCNNDNQDIVSMGTNSALIARRVIENAFEVLSIHLITIIQAVDFLGLYPKLSTFNKEKYDCLRNEVPVFFNDTPKYLEIEKIRKVLLNEILN